METKYVRVPFDIEMAKKITNGKVEGRVVTRDDGNARIICWDAEGDQPIIALIKYHDKEYPHNFCLNGLLQDGDCLNGDLMLEIPEYMTFKDGDILVTPDNRIFVLCLRENGKFYFYAGTFMEGSTIVNLTSEPTLVFEDNKAGCRRATPNEINDFAEKLKEHNNPKAKECIKQYLKRFFKIELKTEFEFKPYDKVLVRESNDFPWRIDLFSHIQDGAKPYVCLYHYWKYCIPYNDQTKHLLGTTDNWEGKI